MFGLLILISGLALIAGLLYCNGIPDYYTLPSWTTSWITFQSKPKRSLTHNQSSNHPDSPILNTPSQTQTIHCPLCLEVVDRTNCIPKLTCTHVSCMHCFQAYIHSQVSDVSCYPLKCFSCTQSISADKVQETCTVEMYRKYQIWNARGQGKTSLECTQCHELLIVESGLTTGLIECSKCHFLMCIHCKHSLIHCTERCSSNPNVEHTEEQLRQKKLSEWLEEIQLLQLMEQQQWCKCPRCAQLIERAGGCFHMTHLNCPRALENQRNTHFCYCCSTELLHSYYRQELLTGQTHFEFSLYSDCVRAAEGREARTRLVQDCRSRIQILQLRLENGSIHKQGDCRLIALDVYGNKWKVWTYHWFGYAKYHSVELPSIQQQSLDNALATCTCKKYIQSNNNSCKHITCAEILRKDIAQQLATKSTV